MIPQLFALLFLLVKLYIWALILSALFSMLASLNVIDNRNRVVFAIGDFLYRITEPALRPIRNLLPRFSAIDISPMIAILALQYLVLPLLGGIYGAILSGSLRPLLF